MKIVHDTREHKFTAYTDDDRRMGEIGYAPQDGKLIATHTVVDDEFRGRGVAQELLDALVAHAEKEKMRIVPQCSFVASSFEKFPDKYRSVIDVDDKR